MVGAEVVDVGVEVVDVVDVLAREVAVPAVDTGVHAVATTSKVAIRACLTVAEDTAGPCQEGHPERVSWSNGIITRTMPAAPGATAYWSNKAMTPPSVTRKLASSRS